MVRLRVNQRSVNDINILPFAAIDVGSHAHIQNYRQSVIKHHWNEKYVNKCIRVACFGCLMYLHFVFLVLQVFCWKGKYKRNRRLHVVALVFIIFSCLIRLVLSSIKSFLQLYSEVIPTYFISDLKNHNNGTTWANQRCIIFYKSHQTEMKFSIWCATIFQALALSLF